MSMSRPKQEAVSSQLQECDAVEASATVLRGKVLTGNARPGQGAAAPLQQPRGKAAQLLHGALPLAPESAERVTGSELSGPHAAEAPSLPLPSMAMPQHGPEGGELPALRAAALPCEALGGEGAPAQDPAACSQPEADAAEAPGTALLGLAKAEHGPEVYQRPSLQAAPSPCKVLQGDDTAAQGAAGPAPCPLPGFHAVQTLPGTSTLAAESAQLAMASSQPGPADAPGSAMTVQEAETLGRELCAQVSSNNKT